MKNTIPLKSPVLLASLTLMVGAASAATIYNHDFTGAAAADLNGLNPDTGSGSWTASTDWKADGSIATVGSSAEDDSAFLTFTPTGGNVYTISATFSLPTLGENTFAWAGVGFTASNVTGSHTSGAGFFSSPNNAAPWMLYRHNTQVVSFTGTGSSGSAGEGNYGGTRTLSVDLDTTGAQWTAEWYVDGTSVRTHTFGSNPTISNVGFGRENGAGTTISNFSLTVVPEPSSATLFGLGALGLLLRRRR